jgi:hypothetical protein
MIAVESLFVCTDALNSVATDKNKNKENIKRPESKKRSIKVSREGMRKGLTVTENGTDLML